MEVTEMEVEEEQPGPNPSNSNPSKRFGLRNSIQTNFGDDYVFQITPTEDWTAMAVSLSTNVVKLYSPATGQYLGECKGHSAAINHIAFSGPMLMPHLLHSCSSDGTIRAWDTRTFQQVSLISAGPSQEVFSFSFGGTGDLLAGGCKSQILFWDWRNKKQVACLEESHVEDVTQVHFIPGTENKLLSASVDGLMCIFDTAGDVNDDDHLESVMNVGTSIGKVGFFGEKYQKLWCLTHIETLSIWNWKDATSEANLQEARSFASDSWTRDHVDYFVDCHCSSEDDCLWIIGGTNAGTTGYFPVNYTGSGSIGPPEAILEGGHTGVVRNVLLTSGTLRGHSQNHGVFGWTGGEDGRLCCWLSDETANTNHAWISGELVIKAQKHSRKNRHQPY
ncbi:Protein gts1 [Ancistrocladus abbreviatus]